VVTVQFLLNCVPVQQGGPQPELVMDGIAGPKTNRAIEVFQLRNLGFADGRVDPGGRTLRALQQFDPAPNQPLGFGGGKRGGTKKGGGFPLGKKSGPGLGADFGGKTGPGGKFGGKTAPGGKFGGKSAPGGKLGGGPGFKF
jgi:peptidoglycan hydrolase-like protein with peptidoglycan-binding domain